MRQHSSRHNRLTSVSVTAMVTLLGCSVGCESFKHHMTNHSMIAKVAEKYDGRYYHCAHCGQIIPREGFDKCPRCFQVPMYHGYEPTCWRQWPQGWGCPPETVVNHTDFWSQGMMETDGSQAEMPIEEVEAPEEDEAYRDLETEIEKQDVSAPIRLPKMLTSDTLQSESPGVDRDTFVAHYLTAESNPGPQLPQVSIVLHDRPVQKTEPDAVNNVRSLEAAGPMAAKFSMPKSEQADDEPVSKLTPPAAEQASKVAMAIEAIVDETSDANPATVLPSLVRTHAAVIDATESAVSPEVPEEIPSKIRKLLPRDEFGPIPVRNVRLAEPSISRRALAAKGAVTKSVPIASTIAEQNDAKNVTTGSEEFPPPINRFVIPEPTSSDVDGPVPARRIQLSDLPVQIQR